MKTQFLYKKSVLKMTACIIGYSIWVIASSSHTVTTWFTVPLYFYNVVEQCTINAPATVNIQLHGPRAALRQLKASTTAVHINAAEFREGIQSISLSSTMIFLPPCVQMLESTPHTVEICITKKDVPAAVIV